MSTEPGAPAEEPPSDEPDQPATKRFVSSMIKLSETRLKDELKPLSDNMVNSMIERAISNLRSTLESERRQREREQEHEKHEQSMRYHERFMGIAIGIAIGSAGTMILFTLAHHP